MGHDHEHTHDGHDHSHADAGCRDAVEALYEYLDGELTDAKRERIQSHLDGCGPCFEAYDFEAELRLVVKAHCEESVPDELRSRILEALGGADDTQPA